MKRIAFAFGLVAATAFAAPLSAQSRNDGPWWDPANTGTRTDSRTDTRTRDGRVYDDGRIYDQRRADGSWRREGRDRSGNIIYVRTRYDSNGNLIRERARRDTLGRYRVIDRDVIRYADNRNGRVRDRNGDGWEDRQANGRDRNDRWDQNDGHDNGKHNGKYKNKGHKNGKSNGKGRR